MSMNVSVASLANGPPKGVSPSELFTRLAAMKRPQKIIDHPRKDPDTGVSMGQMILVPLTESELMQCRAAAEVYARAELERSKTQTPGDSLGYRDIYTNELYVELLVRACKTIHTVELPVYYSAKAMRDQLFPDEIAILFEAYSFWQSESGPIVSHMTAPEMEAWITVLSEGASTVPLAALSSEAKNALLLHTVAQLQSLRTDKSSPGSLVEEFTPTASAEEAGESVDQEPTHG
jgi:hypothetical protein